jgi:DNA adenine methylase
MSILNERRLTPLLKYPGGKKNEVKFFSDILPNQANRYFEPFVGGGALYFSVNIQSKHINDISKELIDFYKYIKNANEDFHEKLDTISHYWDLLSDVASHNSEVLVELYKQFKRDSINIDTLKNEINIFSLNNAVGFNGLLDNDINVGNNNFLRELNRMLVNKFKRMKKIELDLLDADKGSNDNNYKLLSDSDIEENIETAFKSALYYHFRYIYNNKDNFNISNEFYTAIYFFIREYCFSSMFRYNREGNFNVPFGGISYAKKSITSKIETIKSLEVNRHLNNTQIYNLDYLSFLNSYNLTWDDFIFLDPPYDTEFSTYANNIFDLNEHKKLSEYLKTKCEAKFLMVIKQTDEISKLYKNNEIILNGRVLKVESFNKKYFVSFKNRNTKEVTHLLIYNY